MILKQCIANGTLSYQALPGFFVHTDPNAKESDIGPVPARFGLLDSSSEYWKNLDDKLNGLEKASPDALFKVVWAGRHGQVCLRMIDDVLSQWSEVFSCLKGWHNVGEAKYGTKVRD